MSKTLTSLRNHYECFLIWLGAAPPEDCCEQPPKVEDEDGLGNRWNKALEENLPDPEQADQAIERNWRITRHYACWYLQRPHLFKWAGMAAFASHRVGFFLMEAEDQNPDVELMRLTNNKVFADVGWAHLAYMQQGLAAVEEILAGQPDYELMLKGFRLINEGKKKLGQAKRLNGSHIEEREKDANKLEAEANELIWRGKYLIAQTGTGRHGAA